MNRNEVKSLLLEAFGEKVVTDFMIDLWHSFLSEIDHSIVLFNFNCFKEIGHTRCITIADLLKGPTDYETHNSIH